MLTTVISFASAAGSTYHLPDGMRVNLYAAGMVSTGEGKDRPRVCAADMARVAGVRVIGRAASGEGLEDEVGAKGVQSVLQPLDEVSYIIEAIEGSNRPPYLAALNSAYLQFFSASNSTYVGRARSGKPGITIEHPALSVLGFSVPTEMGKALRTAGVLAGLANRFLWAFGRDNVTPRLIDEDVPMPEAVRIALDTISRRRGTVALAEAMTATSEDIENPASATIKYAPGLREHRERLLVQFNVATKTGDERTRALYQRSFEKTMRVAGTVAVIDNPQAPVITTDILAWAAAFVRASDAALARFVLVHMTGGEQQNFASIIFEWCKEARAALDIEGGTKARDNALKKRFPGASAKYQQALLQGYIPERLITRGLRDLDSKQREAGILYLCDRGDMHRVEWKEDGKRSRMKLLAFGPDDDE